MKAQASKNTEAKYLFISPYIRSYKIKQKFSKVKIQKTVIPALGNVS